MTTITPTTIPAIAPDGKLELEEGEAEDEATEAGEAEDKATEADDTAKEAETRAEDADATELTAATELAQSGMTWGYTSCRSTTRSTRSGRRYGISLWHLTGGSYGTIAVQGIRLQ
jgi:hypothetical protein